MSAEVVSMQEAQSSLAQLVKRAAAGESILIGNCGRAEAVLSSVSNIKPKRQLGGMEGKLIIPDDFDDPLPPEVLAAFGYGEAGK